MANPRGRPTNEMRAQRAAQAAELANRAAQETAVTPELPIETQAPPERPEPEEKDNLVRRPPKNEPRRLAQEEIYARDIQTKKGLGIELGLTDEETPPVAEKPQTPQDPPPPTPESMLQGGKFSSPTVRVKVDGEEYDVTQEEVETYGGVKAYQIARAAENRLQKAQETLAEVRKLQETKVEKPVTPDEFIKQKIEVLRWGTPDESAAALREILAHQNKPVDENALVQRATDQMRHDEAVRNFDKEFTDIAASPLHLKLIVALRNERLLQGHPGDWGNFYRSLGNEVRGVMPKQNQPGASQMKAGETSLPSDKEARKSSIVNLPTASAQRATLPEEPKPESRADILAQMRKSRGFQT
jgi:hypothetical protein